MAKNLDVVNWQTAMREALYNGVSETDVIEIVQGLVAKAKKGDLKAIDMLLKWTIGQPQPQVTVNQIVAQPAPPVRQDHILDISRPMAASPRRSEPILELPVKKPSGDPSPEEIKERAMAIRLENAERKRQAQ